jgi:hypothetical protein
VTVPTIKIDHTYRSTCLPYYFILFVDLGSQMKQQANISTLTPSCDAMSGSMKLQSEFLLYNEVPEAAIDASRNSGCVKHLSALAKKYLCIVAAIVSSALLATL